jgi:histidyl-tRNA synthetase
MDEGASSGRDLKAITGFADYQEAEHIRIDDWLRRLKDIFSKNGFCPFHPRPVEHTEMLTKKGGINGQVYVLGRLQDKSITDLALPFDRTVPLALWVNRHANDIVFPYKRFDISHSWRGEHAQKGQFRAFIQADVDVLGRDLSLLADAECIATIWQGLTALGINAFHMYLNHMQISRSLLLTLKPDENQINQLLGIVDKIEKVSKTDLLDEIKKVLPERSNEELDEFYETIRFKGPFTEFPRKVLAHDTCANEAFQQLEELFTLLEVYRIDCSRLQFCPAMVRGLNYYTGVVFETFLDDVPRGGSIASGGRYNDLVGKVSDDVSVCSANLEGVGGSIGVTRLFELVKEKASCGSRTIADVSVIYRNDLEKGKSFQKRAIEMALALREHGLKVDVGGTHQKMKTLLSYADRKGFPFVISIMDDNSVVVKDLVNNAQSDLLNDSLAVEALLHKVKMLSNL